MANSSNKPLNLDYLISKATEQHLNSIWHPLPPSTILYLATDGLETKLIRLINTVLANQERLQSFLVYELKSIREEQKLQADTLLIRFEQGSIPTQDSTQLISNVTEILRNLQNEVNLTNNRLKDISSDLDQFFDVQLTTDQRFELTIPIIPFILEYKSSIGATSTVGLSNLFDSIEQFWNKWTQ